MFDELTRDEVYDMILKLHTHTQYFVPVDDLPALNLAIEALELAYNNEFEDRGE